MGGRVGTQEFGATEVITNDCVTAVALTKSALIIRLAMVISQSMGNIQG